MSKPRPVVFIVNSDNPKQNGAYTIGKDGRTLRRVRQPRRFERKLSVAYNGDIYRVHYVATVLSKIASKGAQRK